jgi:hypothetical protein
MKETVKQQRIVGLLNQPQPSSDCHEKTIGVFYHKRTAVQIMNVLKKEYKTQQHDYMIEPMAVKKTLPAWH